MYHAILWAVILLMGFVIALMHQRLKRFDTRLTLLTRTVSVEMDAAEHRHEVYHGLVGRVVKLERQHQYHPNTYVRGWKDPRSDDSVFATQESQRHSVGQAQSVNRQAQS